jgi:hypothetical protein
LAEALELWRADPLLPFKVDPALLLTLAGLTPDPWQADLLRSARTRTLLLCSRQTGKSTAAAALALRTALLGAGSLTLLLSPTLRQSGELFRQRLLPLYHALGDPVPARGVTATELRLANGSRVVSLPENEAGIRGFSKVSLLLIDEAARVSDELYHAVLPMLLVSRGSLLALSTPFGRRGWFYDAWADGTGWHKVWARASQCPRFSAAQLAEQRLRLGERGYAQEVELAFVGVEGQAFDQGAITRAFEAGGAAPLYGG